MIFFFFLQSTCFPHPSACSRAITIFTSTPSFIYGKLYCCPMTSAVFIWPDDTMQRCRKAPLEHRLFTLSLRSALFLTNNGGVKYYYTGLMGQRSFNWRLNVFACQQSFAPEAPQRTIQLQLISHTILIIHRLFCFFVTFWDFFHSVTT